MSSKQRRKSSKGSRLWRLTPLASLLPPFWRCVVQCRRHNVQNKFGGAMELTGIILLAVLVVVLIYFVMLYNQLVQVKHNVSKAWANIDVVLKAAPRRASQARRDLQAVHEVRAGDAHARDGGALRRVGSPRAAEHRRARPGGRRPARRARAASSRSPRPIPISSRTRPFCSCRRASRAWRTPSPTGASSTTSRSTSTTCASSNSPIRSSLRCSASRLSSRSSSLRKRKPTSR